MFLMIGMNQGRKDLNYDQLVICTQCGQYGRYRVFMTFTQLLLFFIPCFKWGRKYYVQMSCCGTVYELDPAIGERIARGDQVQISPSDLTRTGISGGTAGMNGYGSGYGSGDGNSGYSHMRKRCASCGYETTEDFAYCPKCGSSLD